MLSKVAKVFVASILSVLLLSSFAVAEIKVNNPYENVKWDSFGQYKGNLHTHTNHSEKYNPSALKPEQLILEYSNRDYDILAITDHNTLTWPWDDYTKENSLKMLPVQGNEISNTHHLLSLFSDFNTTMSNEKEVLKQIGEKEGLAIMAHPGRYNASSKWYANLFVTYPHLVGMEVINQGDRYQDDREMWDKTLSVLPPDNLCWGFANDDTHKVEHIGRDWNIFLLPELTEEDLKDSMITGAFYFSSISTLENVVGCPPIINEINVDEKLNTISISAQNSQKVVWISEGNIIHIGDSVNYKNAKGMGSYVRAEIIGEGGVSYTQPFGIKK
ncbi:hypothetical protein PRVXT_000461 [Proteinivorax tanatarense]|uniref:Polymerase/histidinol phosphatase N-terminal domain-containing protein n=1 Tax=Proteinivorax tanatarense TaxID=1260629 RepID=A0AAU7VND8_9FIRM